METYKNLLQQLVDFKNPTALPALMEQLRKFDKDRQDRIVHLPLEKIASVLTRYISGELSAEDVEEWANAVEIREDIELGDDNDPASTNVVWELANPLLTRPLTHDRARALIDQLSA